MPEKRHEILDCCLRHPRLTPLAQTATMVFRLTASQMGQLEPELRTVNDERLEMCLAIPARIVELDADKAMVDAMGNRFKAKTTLLPEAKLGDVVLVHAGFAISLVDEEEAKKTWELFAEIANFEQTQNKLSG